MAEEPSLEEAVDELKHRVNSAVSALSARAKQDRIRRDKHDEIERRLAGIIKRIEEFSGG